MLRNRSVVRIMIGGILVAGLLGGAGAVSVEPDMPRLEDPYPPEETWEDQIINALLELCEILNCDATSEVGAAATEAAVRVCKAYHTNGVVPWLTTSQVNQGSVDVGAAIAVLSEDPGVLDASVHDELDGVLQLMKLDLDERK